MSLTAMALWEDASRAAPRLAKQVLHPHLPPARGSQLVGSCRQQGLAALGRHLSGAFSGRKPPPAGPRPLSALRLAPRVRLRSVLSKVDRLLSNLQASIQPASGPQLAGQLLLRATVHSVLEWARVVLSTQPARQSARDSRSLLSTLLAAGRDPPPSSQRSKRVTPRAPSGQQSVRSPGLTVTMLELLCRRKGHPSPLLRCRLPASRVGTLQRATSPLAGSPERLRGPSPHRSQTRPSEESRVSPAATASQTSRRSRMTPPSSSSTCPTPGHSQATATKSLRGVRSVQTWA